MTEKPLSKHALKTRQTRHELLQAAEKIFARDGYEAADLNEIAALAGRTRGAIYAQFKSKEEVFLALIADRRDTHRKRMMKLLESSSDVAENLQTMRAFTLKMLEDSTWAMLLLEFKLFTLRHPESRKNLQSLFAENFRASDARLYNSILGAAPEKDGSISRLLAVQSLYPMLTALQLEAEVSDPPLSKASVRKIALRLFDALLPACDH